MMVMLRKIHGEFDGGDEEQHSRTTRTRIQEQLRKRHRRILSEEERSTTCTSRSMTMIDEDAEYETPPLPKEFKYDDEQDEEEVGRQAAHQGFIATHSKMFDYFHPLS
jgi:hypothetical protein